MHKSLLAVLSLLLAGCGGYPEEISPVKPFDVDRYLGKWYEISRLDHSFERGLEQVSAEYTMLENGRIKVVNRGFSARENTWKVATGKAYIAGETDEGYLKVSFFGPFYSSYVVFGLDEQNYQYAYVSGPSHNYLWLLSRTPVVEQQIVQHFVETAGNRGFETRNLIYVKQQ